MTIMRAAILAGALFALTKQGKVTCDGLDVDEVAGDTAAPLRDDHLARREWVENEEHAR